MKKLSDLNVAEVSLVPRGANKKKFLIFKNLAEMKKTKSVAGNTSKPEHTQKVGKAMNNEIMNLINAVDPETMKKVDKVLKGMKKMKKFKGVEGEDAHKSSDGDMAPRKDSAAYKMKKTKKEDCAKDDMGDVEMGDHQEMGEGEDSQPLSERAQAAVKAISRIAAPFKDELSHDHIKAALKEVGFHPGAEEMPQDEKDPSDEKVHMNWAIPEGVEGEHHEDALDMARKTYKSHLEKMGYRKYPDPALDETNAMQKNKHGVDEDDDEEEEESVGKIAKSAFDLSSFPKEQRAQLDMIFKSHNELVQKNADLEKELRVERDVRKQKEFEERAKSFKHLGVNSVELGTIMKSLSEKDSVNFEKVERILKSVNNQVAAGSNLYGEIGTRISKSDAGSAEAKLDTLVDSVVHKSEGKSREQVYDDVTRTKEGKRLLSEVMEEQHANLRRMGAN